MKLLLLVSALMAPFVLATSALAQTGPYYPSDWPTLRDPTKVVHYVVTDGGLPHPGGSWIADALQILTGGDQVTEDFTIDGHTGKKVTGNNLNIADATFASWAESEFIDILMQVYGDDGLFNAQGQPRNFNFLTGTLPELAAPVGGQIPVEAKNKKWNWVLFRIPNGVRASDGTRFVGSIPANAQGATAKGGVNDGTIRVEGVPNFIVRVIAFGEEGAFGDPTDINKFFPAETCDPEPETNLAGIDFAAGTTNHVQVINDGDQTVTFESSVGPTGDKRHAVVPSGTFLNFGITENYLGKPCNSPRTVKVCVDFYDDPAFAGLAVRFGPEAYATDDKGGIAIYPAASRQMLAGTDKWIRRSWTVPAVNLKGVNAGTLTAGPRFASQGGRVAVSRIEIAVLRVGDHPLAGFDPLAECYSDPNICTDAYGSFAELDLGKDVKNGLDVGTSAGDQEMIIAEAGPSGDRRQAIRPAREDGTPGYAHQYLQFAILNEALGPNTQPPAHLAMCITYYDDPALIGAQFRPEVYQTEKNGVQTLAFTDNTWLVTLEGTDRWRTAYWEIPDIKFIGVNQKPQAAARIFASSKIFVTAVRYAVIRPCGPRAGVNLLESCNPAVQQPGSKIWEFQADNNIRSTPAIGTDGTIYFNDITGYLYALNSDGTQKWKSPIDYGGTGSYGTSPAIGVDGTVYVGAGKRMFAFKADGTQKWILPTPAGLLSSPAIGSDGTIYFGLSNYTNLFFAVNPDGTKKWAFVAGSRVFSSPAIGADGSIYFGTLDSKTLFALSPNGTKKWELPIGNTYSSPAIGADGIIYIGDNDGKLYAIKSDGTKQWEFQAGDSIGSAPAIGKDGTIYFGSWNSNFYALNPDKSLKWKYVGSERFFGSCPAISDQGTVYFQDDRNKLYAFGPDGTKRWEFETRGEYLLELRAGPTIAKNGTVYIGANDSKLYAIKGDGGPADSPWPVFRRDARHTARARVVAGPQNVNAHQGSSVTFHVETTETQPISFQWLFNGAHLPGATNVSLTLNNITTGQEGIYAVVVTQDGLSQTLSLMTLTVDAAFTKITAGSIVNEAGGSIGCAWGDYDNDGFLDLVVANGNVASQNEFLYHNKGNGTFDKVTTGPVVNAGGVSTSPAWADYDNNGTLDLFIANWSNEPQFSQFLFQNLGDGVFVRVTNVISAVDLSHGCAWADYDGDGNLDLFIANNNTNGNFLYHGNGDGTFERVTTGTIVTDRSSGSSDGVWGDYNNDGRPDLFLTNLGGNNALYRNEGNGAFTRITAGLIVNDGSANGAAWGDYDNDGNLDLVTTGAGEARLYHNNGFGGFTKTVMTNPGTELAACAWGDYDNDGFLDLFVTDRLGHNNIMYHNNGDGTFNQVTSGSPVNDGGHSWSAAFGDYDNDGFLDLFVCNRGGENNFLYRNNGNSNHWFKANLIGTSSNRSAIGAKVRLKAVIGGRELWQLCEVASGGSFGEASLNIHFGLGNAAKVEALRIEWPSGIVQEMGGLAVDQFVTIAEPPVLKVGEGATATGFEMILTSRGGFTYEIQSSTDLVNWSFWKTISKVNGSVQVVDTQSPLPATRFFRVRPQ